MSVLFDVKDHVAYVTIDRADRMNAVIPTPMRRSTTSGSRLRPAMIFAASC